MNDYYKSLPKKRSDAGALIFNDKDEILLVKPNYKDHWSIPRGTVDDNESPKAACLREIKEEIGLVIDNITFLCVDYASAKLDKNEAFQFIFYGGVLDEKQISQIKLEEKELDSYKFVSISEAEKLLGNNLARRLPKCVKAIKTGEAIYLENGIL